MATAKTKISDMVSLLNPNTGKIENHSAAAVKTRIKKVYSLTDKQAALVMVSERARSGLYFS